VSDLLQRLRGILLGGPKPPVLEEARFPVDRMRRPDLTRFTRPLEHYVGYIETYLASLQPIPRGQPVPPERRSSEWQAHAYHKGVFGQWGLIAIGPAKALDYVLTLLRHDLPEGRQSGAGVLEAWVEAGQSADLTAHALAFAEREASESEPDPETISVLITVLGRAKRRDALPLLARIFRAPWANVGDVDFDAATAIGEIAGKSFARKPDPRAAAEQWLTEQGL
jgi:hypothetical protein